MNKLLLTTICAAIATSGASAFTLDLSSLNGTTLGQATITNMYGAFQISGNSSVSVDNDSVTLNNNQGLNISYPANVTYEGAFISGNAIVSDAFNVVSIISTEAGNNISNLTFSSNAVPEPSSTALLGLGGLALIMRRRK